jgi:Uma2 family endonuclease
LLGRERGEVVGGEIVDKAAPSFEHGDAQRALASLIGDGFHRRPGGSRPGGWWIATEVEIEFDTHEVYLPDLAGWRRDRVPARPSGRPITVRPDWVCEILSPSTARRDQVVKHRTLHRCKVPHYWLVDPERETLAVYRWHADGFILVLTADRAETVRAEPFESIEIRLGLLFGDDPED